VTAGSPVFAGSLIALHWLIRRATMNSIVASPLLLMALAYIKYETKLDNLHRALIEITDSFPDTSSKNTDNSKGI
jgi:hypothetical protein